MTINLIPVFFFQREKTITFISAMIEKQAFFVAVVGYMKEIIDAPSAEISNMVDNIKWCMNQPLIKFYPHNVIITQVLCIFVR